MLDDDLDKIVGDGDISLDDIKDSELDDLLADVTSNEEISGKVLGDEPEVVPDSKDVSSKNNNVDVAQLSSAKDDDFASLNLNDFDAALNSYKAARAGKVSVVVQDTTAENSDVVVSGEENRSPLSSADFNEEPIPDIPSFGSKPMLMKPSTVDESGFVSNSEERQQEIMNWYSGSLKDKTYKISIDDMPEFLDSDKTIRVIHVDVNSSYGWNVFFDNGVFMSLHDLKEYQERHGEMPCQDGKIIYGSKTCTFERILRVVVYEQPRYFSYKIKS